MKTFNYHSVNDVKEASKLASPNSAFLAGGMTTIPSMKLGLATYKDIIDIKNIKKLSGIKISGKSVLNLAYSGNAPLKEYATLREYLSTNVQKILWFYYEGNDLDNLKDELKAIKYLKERGIDGRTAKKFGIGYAKKGMVARPQNSARCCRRGRYVRFID